MVSYTDPLSAQGTTIELLAPTGWACPASALPLLPWEEECGPGHEAGLVEEAVHSCTFDC